MRTCFMCVRTSPVVRNARRTYVRTLMAIDFQGRHIVPRQKRLAINKAGSRRITRPFINPQFRRLRICHAYYNKRAYIVERQRVCRCELLHERANERTELERCYWRRMRSRSFRRKRISLQRDQRYIESVREGYVCIYLSPRNIPADELSKVEVD